MIYATTDFWRMTPSRDDLAPGSIFTAKVGDVAVLALSAYEKNDRFGLILSTIGTDVDFTKYPPPATRFFSSMTGPFYVLRDGIVPIIRPRISNGSPNFPNAPGMGARHGDLAIDHGGEEYLICDDYPQGDRKYRLIANLRSGECNNAGAITPVFYPNWEMLVLDGFGSTSLMLSTR